MGKLQEWLLNLFALLGNQSGVEKDPNPKKTMVVEEETEDDLETKEDEENAEGEETEGEEEEDEDGEDNAGDDSGNNVGKDRSKYVPRKRFDEVNSKAQRVEELVESGVLVEGTDGQLYLNPKTLKKQKSEETDDEDDENYNFTKDEVDDASWPLVQKINRGFKKFDGLAGQFTYIIRQQGAELAIIRDYPEILQKDSPLKKKAQDLLKNDPEFKAKYKGDPEKGYWAVKRAAEMLSGRQPLKKKPNKSKFIIGRGDGGKGGKSKIVDFSKMTKDQLDELERQEHDRIHGGRKK